jgi:hypothetical protein
MGSPRHYLLLLERWLILSSVDCLRARCASCPCQYAFLEQAGQGLRQAARGRRRGHFRLFRCSGCHSARHRRENHDASPGQYRTAAAVDRRGYHTVDLLVCILGRDRSVRFDVLNHCRAYPHPRLSRDQRVFLSFPARTHSRRQGSSRPSLRKIHFDTESHKLYYVNKEIRAELD